MQSILELELLVLELLGKLVGAFICAVEDVAATNPFLQFLSSNLASTLKLLAQSQLPTNRKSRILEPCDCLCIRKSGLRHHLEHIGQRELVSSLTCFGFFGSPTP